MWASTGGAAHNGYQESPTQGTTHPGRGAEAHTRKLVDKGSTSVPSTPSSPEGLEPPRSPHGA